jgi:cyclopropane fatty-acyl-phospholipid synthase-like methyltransferase
LKSRKLHFVLALGLLAGAAVSASAQSRQYGNSLAPDVTSPQAIVDRMLELANVKPGDTVYDLGCGQGRVLITAAEQFHANAVGIEISDRLFRRATDNIALRGLQNRIKLIHGDLLEADLSNADVVTIYLMTTSNESLRPRLEKYLKPGARVVSHDYKVPGWKPTQVEETQANSHAHMIYLYVMPPVKQQ